MAQNNVEVERFTSDGTSGLSVEITNSFENANFPGNGPTPPSAPEHPPPEDGDYGDDILHDGLIAVVKTENTAVYVEIRYNDALSGPWQLNHDIEIIHYDDGLL